VLPTAYARQMRQAVPVLTHSMADGWGPGLAVYPGVGRARWQCQRNLVLCADKLADGWVVALTSNSNTGAGLWREFQAELARVGVPIDVPVSRRRAGRESRSARLRRRVHQR